MAADFAGQVQSGRVAVVRVENTARGGSVAARSGVGRSNAGGFFVSEERPATAAVTAQPAVAATGIDALLALQAVDDPLLGRKKAIRRGTALLDTLEQIKADLLVGRVSEGRLNQLMALIGQARERNLPGLDGVLDDIE